LEFELIWLEKCIQRGHLSENQVFGVQGEQSQGNEGENLAVEDRVGFQREAVDQAYVEQQEKGVGQAEVVGNLQLAEKVFVHDYRVGLKSLEKGRAGFMGFCVWSWVRSCD
jgi:hypothetical protein